MKRPTTKAKTKPKPRARRVAAHTSPPNITLSTPVMYVEPVRSPERGPTARKLDAARREIRLLLQVAQYFAGGSTRNETIIERMNAALDALR